MSKILTGIKNFFGKVKGSTEGVIVGTELKRSVLTSLGFGSVAALVVAVLQQIIIDLPALLPASPIVGLATTVLTLILDLYRRKAQSDPAVATSPVAAPTAGAALVAAALLAAPAPEGQSEFSRSPSYHQEPVSGRILSFAPLPDRERSN